MAESGVIAPIFRTAIGGLSDDIFVGIDGSFFSSKNINIRDNARGISLNRALAKDSATTVVEKINKIIRVTTTDYMAFGSSGGIYRKTGGSWVKITTNTPATAVLDALEFNGYIYWTTTSGLHRLAKGSISDNITAAESINRQALDTASYHPLEIKTGDMFVGNGSKLGKVDILNVYSALFTLESNATIKEINMFGGIIRILTISSLGGNTIYLWSGTEDSPDETIPLPGWNVYHSVIFNGYNYLITSKGLCALDGYNVYIIKETDQFKDTLASFAIFNQKLYIGGIGGVYCFGAKNKNYPNVLNLEHTTSNGNTADEINAIFSDGTDLYVSWSQSTNYGIDKLGTNYALAGELITKGYYAKDLHDIKEAIMLTYGFKPLLANEKITVSYSVDGGIYVKIRDVISTTDTLDTFTDDMPTSTKFQYIQFKIEFVGPGTTTPGLYSMTLKFNNNIKR